MDKERNTNETKRICKLARMGKKLLTQKFFANINKHALGSSSKTIIFKH